MSGMTLWRVGVDKQLGDQEWSNVYTVNAASLAAAITVGSAIVVIEKAVHYDTVSFVNLVVEPAILAGGGGTVVGLSGTGARLGGDEYLPLFNTVRCWFRPAAGKPSQKYLRLPLRELFQANGALVTTERTFVHNNYVLPLLDVNEYVDVDGQEFISGAVYPRVQERQLRRKRRTRAGFKRGWVPV